MCHLGFFTRNFTCLSLFIYTSSCANPASDSIKWKVLTDKNYSVHYTTTDDNRIAYVDSVLRSGINYTAEFFHQPFPNKFDVYIFPNRTTLDKQWQKDWGDSSFHSECWMIASGVAHRLDLLSPNAWTKQACEHNANDVDEIRKVIWHELTHVYQGQYNPDHNFSYIEKLDWLVEGLATYASGQLDEKRLQKIKQLGIENKIPTTLDNFWKGQEKYGLSGSMVAFIDKKYGRNKLFELLKQTNKEGTLKLLDISEIELITDWKKSFL